jgi:hypothetical protein
MATNGEAVDPAAQELRAAFENREQVAARVGALTAPVRVPHPGDIERSRMEPATNAARALLKSGGERAPRLRIDPRRPRGDGAMITPAPESPSPAQTFA